MTCSEFEAVAKSISDLDKLLLLLVQTLSSHNEEKLLNWHKKYIQLKLHTSTLDVSSLIIFKVDVCPIRFQKCDVPSQQQWVKVFISILGKNDVCFRHVLRIGFLSCHIPHFGWGDGGKWMDVMCAVARQHRNVKYSWMVAQQLLRFSPNHRHTDNLQAYPHIYRTSWSLVLSHFLFL